MRKNFGAKAICYPMPVFIIGTYNADGTPNAMNAAWGGISEETEITICVDSGHKTAENLMARKAFTVSMATVNYGDFLRPRYLPPGGADCQCVCGGIRAGSERQGGCEEAPSHHL